MLAPKPPLDFLIDSFVYEEYLGTNDWSEPEYGEPVPVTKCRIDREAVYSASTSGKVLLYSAVIFLYAGMTENMVDTFKAESRVYFDGVERTITKVIPNYEPYQNILYSVEIEVV